ncbi:hypothetical protein MN032_11165 [Agromyces atrinae]|uniref:hypothetical protein n=1 Tax=Agromyces atrinae TaxID=592376 RepID=UPI001F595E4B|nr:hypothetical protein [Agromyces atrinae]MCI2958258.1 hypothetical protein [Agromyces atrinae]
MAENSWPFRGQGPTSELQFSKLFRLLGTGVDRGIWNALRVYGDSTGRQVKVATGMAHVRGHQFENDAVRTLAIDPSPGTPRRDLVVLHLEYGDVKSIRLRVVKGVSKANPEPPQPVQTLSGVYQFVLAEVFVGAGAATITAEQVTDRRKFLSPMGDVAMIAYPDNRLTATSGWIGSSEARLTNETFVRDDDVEIYLKLRRTTAALITPASNGRFPGNPVIGRLNENWRPRTQNEFLVPMLYSDGTTSSEGSLVVRADGNIILFSGQPGVPIRQVNQTVAPAAPRWSVAANLRYTRAT